MAIRLFSMGSARREFVDRPAATARRRQSTRNERWQRRTRRWLATIQATSHMTGSRSARNSGWETAAPGSSSSLREVAASCDTCGCGRHRRHSGSGCGRPACGTGEPERHLPGFLWRPRRAHRRLHRLRGGRGCIARWRRRSLNSASRTLCGRIVRGQFGEDDGHHGPLCEAANDLLGRVGEQISLLSLASSKARASDPGRCMVSASVNSSHSPRASSTPAISALFFPVQPGGGRCGRNHAHSGKTLGDLAGAVGGGVVDHDDLESDAGLGTFRRLTMQAAARFASSLRAGTMIETLG